MNFLAEIKKHRKTLFCNITRYQMLKDKNPLSSVKVVGSVWVPKDEAFYIDEEGYFTTYKLNEDNEWLKS